MSFDAIPDLLADLLHEQRNTNEVLTRLIETLAGLRTKAEANLKAGKATSAKAAPLDTAAPTAVAAPVETPAALAQSASASQAPLDYKADVAPTFAKLLSAKGAPAVVAVLARFGVQKGVELAPAQLADALAAAHAALAE